MRKLQRLAHTLGFLCAGLLILRRGGRCGGPGSEGGASREQRVDRTPAVGSPLRWRRSRPSADGVQRSQVLMEYSPYGCLAESVRVRKRVHTPRGVKEIPLSSLNTFLL